MASLSKWPNGSWRIQFTAPSGKRATLTLGKITKSAAATINSHVEQLIAAALSADAPPARTASWLGEISATLKSRLAKCGLVAAAPAPAPQRRSVTLSELIDSYCDSKYPQYKPGTVEVHEKAFANLIERFGRNRDIASLNYGDAEDFRDWLLNEKKLADSTCRKRCSIANKIFRFALRREWVTKLIFEDVPKANVATNEFHFVTKDEADAVLDKLPDWQWRAVFALSRYGGLRVPSEIVGLRREHVDLVAGRLLVMSPKTARYAGHASREVPIFPELRPYLEDALEASPGPLLVPMIVGKQGKSLRAPVERAAKLACVEQWPRLWHNLRACRQTELTDEWPAHVVTAWMGNSKEVAERHYLRTLEDHFARAADVPPPRKSTQKATHRARKS